MDNNAQNCFNVVCECPLECNRAKICVYCVSFSCLIVDRNYVIRLSTYIPYGPSMMYNLKPVAGFSFESLGLYVIDGPHGSCCENTLHFVLCNVGWTSVDIIKVRLFWEGYKNLRNLPHGFDIYLVNVKKIA